MALCKKCEYAVRVMGGIDTPPGEEGPKSECRECKQHIGNPVNKVCKKCSEEKGISEGCGEALKPVTA